jgi:hypothetical protein
MLETEAGAAQSRPQPKYRVPECDLVLRYNNPGASEPLVVPVHLVCNTPDDILIANVKANSALDRAWVGTRAAHDGVALICGSGPSLADDLDTIRSMRERGGLVFALNGAAKFLSENGILPDVQVIVDAREQTIGLIGPAKQHFFASQVHPSLFAAVPDAAVLQVNFYENHNDFLGLIKGLGSSECALVGSHGSCGNVTVALACARGFRDIHCFGFDSSFRGGEGHAFPQPMNVSEPICDVEYAGKKYLSTFTMKSQADVFPRLTYELEELGCKFTIHGSGYLQDRWRGERAKSLEQREADKYREMWSYDAYRQLAPGEAHVDDAIAKLGIKPGDTLIDYGCGTGRATKAMIDRGIDAAGIDFAPNALEEDVPFTLSALWDLHLISPAADWAFCTDVMEHIPPEKVGIVLQNIASTIGLRGAYFAIDSTRDDMGQLIGQPLHMTVRLPEWWAEQLSRHFAKVEQYEDGIFICFKSASA